jgi:hypothetical protein
MKKTNVRDWELFRLRRRAVDISGPVFHPLAMPQVLEDCFRLLLQKASAIPDPFEQAYIDGTLGVYKLNQIDLLRDVFRWAYERSCQRYLAITQTMAEPDPLRVRYREALILVVQAIVRNRCHQRRMFCAWHMNWYRKTIRRSLLKWFWRRCRVGGPRSGRSGEEDGGRATVTYCKIRERYLKSL